MRKIQYLLILGIVVGVSWFSKSLWDFSCREGFLRIPIVFPFADKEPHIFVNVNRQSQLFLLDTGGGVPVFLKEEHLKEIKKKKLVSPEEWYDAKGVKHSSEKYKLIDSVDIGKKLKLREVSVCVDEWSDGALVNYSLESLEEDRKVWRQRAGKVGAEIIRAMPSCLIDFSKSNLFAVRDLKKFQNKTGYSFSDFIEVLLEENYPHLVISVETDFGIKKFALDTGASRTFLRQPSEENYDFQLVKSQKFAIGARDFGPEELFLFSLNKNLEFDGVLGIEFFYKHVVYLDFVNNKALIGPTITKSLGSNPARSSEHEHK